MNVTQEQIAKAFSEHFTLGEVVNFEQLKKGVANKLFKVRTTSGDYVLKVAIRNTENNRILHEVELLNMLQGLPAPRPIKSTNGEYLFAFEDYSAFVYPYLPGEPPEELTDTMIAQAGTALAQIHVQAKDFSSSVSDKRIRFWDIPSYYSLETFRDSTKKVQNAEIKEAAEYALEHIERYSFDAAKLPTGGLHMDYKPENILFKGETLSGIVDFDNSYIAPFALDLSYSLLWFGSEDGALNIKTVRNFLNAYEEVRTLSSAERESLYSYIHHLCLAIILVNTHWLFDTHLPIPEKFTLWCVNEFMPVHLDLLEKEKEFRSILS